MYGIADLETFVAVARYGGITAGAAHVGVSPATTSHRITKLEARLGIQLFHRNSRAFVLSDEGLLFLERVEGILQSLSEAEMEAGGRRAALRGHLRVTMSPWILSRFIMPELPAFRQAHPDLTIEFLSVDRFVSLVEEGQDCAIRVGQLADSSLIARKLSDNHRIICAAPSFVEVHGMPQSVADLAEALWVCLPWQVHLDLGGAQKRLRMRRNVAVSNSDMLTRAAVQGLGLAVKSKLAVADELARGELVEVMAGVLAPDDAPIWFLSPPEGRSRRKVRAFRDLVIRAFDRR